MLVVLIRGVAATRWLAAVRGPTPVAASGGPTAVTASGGLTATTGTLATTDARGSARAGCRWGSGATVSAASGALLESAARPAAGAARSVAIAGRHRHERARAPGARAIALPRSRLGL